MPIFKHLNPTNITSPEANRIGLLSIEQQSRKTKDMFGTIAPIQRVPPGYHPLSTDLI